jgi:protein SCO1/2
MIKKILPILLIIILGVSIYLMNIPKNNATNFDGDYSFILDTKSGTINSNDYKDKVMILYFGYMNCPDICPTTLYDVNNALDLLDKKEQEQVETIFISVDPSRDTLELLDDYVKYFNKKFLGATSDEKYIKDLASRYMAYYKYEKQNDSAIDYTVAHTTRIYIVNKDGNLKETLSTHNIDKQQIAKAIKDAL